MTIMDESVLRAIRVAPKAVLEAAIENIWKTT